MQSIRTWLLGAIGTAAILGASALAVHAEGIGKPRVAHEDAYAVSAPAPTSFSGCHFGGEVGHANGNLDSLPMGVSAYEWGVLGGCDLQIKQLVIGAFADYDWGRVGSGLNTSAKEWSFGARAGVVVTPATMLYLLVNRPEITIGSTTIDGIGFGGGIETAITRNWRASLEYRHEAFDSPFGAGSPNVNVDSVKGRLSFAIDWPAFR